MLKYESVLDSFSCVIRREFKMGKNLKGKECGKGICQRKDGKYTARYTAQNGSRREMHFNTLPEARNCLADEQYGQRHGIVTPSSDMTVDM